MFNLRAWMVVWPFLLSLWLTAAHGMRDSQVKELRSDPLLPLQGDLIQLNPVLLQTRN